METKMKINLIAYMVYIALIMINIPFIHNDFDINLFSVGFVSGILVVSIIKNLMDYYI